MGGLENGLVNLINHTPAECYRHAIISLTDVTDFQVRIHRQGISVLALHKRQGQDWDSHRQIYQALRKLRPDIVHTRNLGTLEYLLPAAVSRVGVRIHGEHGRDVYDPDGLSFKYNLLRRGIRPFVHRYIAVSSELADWLVATVGVRPDRVSRICNGVDVRCFHPRIGPRCEFGPPGFARPDQVILGTVGRMEAIKDPLTLVRGFLYLINSDFKLRDHLRLAVIGDGALREQAQELVSAAGAEPLVWFAGERNDIPEIMRGLDLFVLPSLREGISNTILEAMASGLPVIATRVGGSPELIADGETGTLVPVGDAQAMARAIRAYLDNPQALTQHGYAGRKRAETEFSIESMIKGYMSVYDSALKGVAAAQYNSQ